MAEKPKSERHTLAVAFGERMRIARVARRLSQEDLARLCHVHRTEVSLLERGFREPRMGTMLKVAGTLEIPTQDLLLGMAHDRAKKGDGFYVEARADQVARKRLKDLPPLP